MKKILPAIIMACLFAGCAFIKTRMLSNRDEVLKVMTYEVVSMIERPVDEVFEYCSYWEHIDSFIPYAVFYPSSEPRIRGVGDYVEGRATTMGLTLPWRWVVVEWDPPRCMKFAFGEDVRGSMRVCLEPKGDQSIATLTSHVYLLPDTLLSNVFDVVVSRNIVWEFLDTQMTDVVRRTIGALEGRDHQTVQFDNEPEYKLFVDAYFTAEEIFPMRPEALFDKFASTEGMNSIMAGSRLEALDDTPDVISGVGDHYQLIAGEDREEPLVYDMFVVQYDYPRELRLHFYAYDTTMEIDYLITPTMTLDSKVIVLFIIDLPDTMAGRALDVIIHTSDIDKRVQEALTGVRETVDDR
jgi:hypothetical protein